MAFFFGSLLSNRVANKELQRTSESGLRTSLAAELSVRRAYARKWRPEVKVRNRLMCIASVITATVSIRSEGLRADDHLEVGAGTTASGGAKLAASVLHPVSTGIAVTANLEWSQRPWIKGERDSVDRRLAYAGVGARLCLFPNERIGNFATVGLGIGHLSSPGGSRPGAWHAVPWTGLGIEARVGNRLYIGAEARIEWLRRRGAMEGELPLRITARLPLGRRSATRGARAAER